MLKKPGNVQEAISRIERQRAITDGRTPSTNVTTENVLRKYGRSLNLLCLIDATGSMTPVWQTTKEQVKEMVGRASQIGNLSMKIMAYRDYCDGSALTEQSDWAMDPNNLAQFIKGISCHGGGDTPEAVEYALMKAAEDKYAEQVILIGDSPPHHTIDHQYNSSRYAGSYVDQCRRLAQKNVRVFTFAIGALFNQETERDFKHIAELTAGAYAVLRETKDLIDFIVMTAASHMGGPKSVDSYLTRYGHGNAELERYGEKLKALPPPSRR